MSDTVLPEGFTRPSDAMAAGALRIRIKPGYVIIRRTEHPKHYGDGLLAIPEKYQDKSMEGVVVAVGPGREYEERYCAGLEGERYADCGALAVARLLRPEDAHDLYAPRLFVCADCLDAHHEEAMGKTRPPMLVRPLLRYRPTEVAVGDRVAFSKWAGAHPTVILGESLILTDDVLGIIDPECSLVTDARAA